jgi:hypothetical protein
MLDMGVYNLLSMQSFHGVWAGNVQECLLKSHIGKARDFEALPETTEAWVRIAMIQLMVRRLAARA